MLKKNAQYSRKANTWSCTSCQAKVRELKTNDELAIAAEHLYPFVYKKIQEIINHPGLVRMKLITSFRIRE
ncbi:hypothetical protein FW778_12590 [Ginsengibacter hankyongi]|uniref:Uncharacterized protein n=1 Tax=Ginsengibacter hankyongi TaxID=2607284 RepID=A0A5J5IEZ2_9BACT|nr:hypothetical protein [Ginsengibacter hankyongi]KAA9038402.1 hypothetical protein FW778_12590 [Ginsengibacter hankyongi]